MATNLCLECGTEVIVDWLHCPQCGTKIVWEDVKAANPYKNPYGVWEVTTEGDCEGRTVTNLGTHEGYVDEIARSLAPQCFYSLQFKAVSPKKAGPVKKGRKEVNVSFNIESGTWNGRTIDAINALGIFNGRPVKVKDGQYFASVTLEFD